MSSRRRGAPALGYEEGTEESKTEVVVTETEEAEKAVEDTDNTKKEGGEGDDGVFEAIDVLRLPTPSDNVAIAIKKTPAGTKTRFTDPMSGDTSVITLEHTVLEGHRFAIRPVAVGEDLQSWGLPFGEAVRPIAPGQYCCNRSILDSLAVRNVDFALPDVGNFKDKIRTYDIDDAAYSEGSQVDAVPPEDVPTFDGFPRPAGRGVGTRNYVVILGLTSQSASYVRAVAAKFKRASFAGTTLDGVVPVAHTEGGSVDEPHNLPLLVRTLSGWICHPNVGAALVVEDMPDTDGKPPMVRFDHVADAAKALRGVDLSDTSQAVVTPLRLSGDFLADVATGEATIAAWMKDSAVANAPRVPTPISHLRIALQCGGSDAFSGVSANPLVGYTAAQLIKNGGAALLAETPELIGAEPYILKNTKDLETSKAFLEFIRKFKRRVENHGETAEANPSGGNKFRGLYNIALKSLGAAAKKHPDVRLDGVLDYGEPLPDTRGYYFMNSPGNDLESIAGQVATGCNFIYFTTGNGSITNFPFVPTIKVLTTTRRYQMLKDDMDFNAGAYLEGMPMPDLGAALLGRTIECAGGVPTVGERAGHSQVSIWREWALTEPTQMAELAKTAVKPTGKGLVVSSGKDGEAAAAAEAEAQFVPMTRGDSVAVDSVGLVLPTSICSSQIAGLIAARLNKRLDRERGTGDADGEAGKTEDAEDAAAADDDDDDDGDSGAFGIKLSDHVSRFVALPHTEGCGSSGAEDLYARVITGHVVNPIVSHCVLLEHGCEKHHNDSVREDMKRADIDPAEFGWASVQLDGGISSVSRRVERLFETSVTSKPKPTVGAPTSRLAGVCIGLTTVDSVPADVGAAFALVVGRLVAAGADVVMPSNSTLLKSSAFLDELLETRDLTPSLGFGDLRPNPTPSTATGAGVLHVMDCPTTHWVETVVGLASAGAQLVLAYSKRPRQGHPLIPTLYVTDVTTPADGGASGAAGAGAAPRAPFADVDVLLTRSDPGSMMGVPDDAIVRPWCKSILDKAMETASRTHTPAAIRTGNVDFQITRGHLGVSV